MPPTNEIPKAMTLGMRKGWIEAIRDNRSNLGEHHVAIRGLFVEHLGSGRVRGEH